MGPTGREGRVTAGAMAPRRRHAAASIDGVKVGGEHRSAAHLGGSPVRASRARPHPRVWNAHEAEEKEKRRTYPRRPRRRTTSPSGSVLPGFVG